MNIGFEAKRVFHNKTGLGNYSRDLVRILANYYPDHFYFLYNPKKAKNTLFVSDSTQILEKNPPSKFYKKFKNYWRQIGVVQDLKKDKIQIFHGLSGELPSGLKTNKIKSVVTIHDLIFVRYPHLYSFFDRKIHFYKFKKAAQQADVVIAISEQTKKDIVEFLKINPNKIKVIYQGCQEVFKLKYTEIELKEVSEKYKLPKTFVLNVGTIEERKNALTIVKAIKHCTVDLVLVGKETDYTKKIHDFISKNDLQNRVHFLKGITSKELAIIYQLASVFVYPSIFEGFGIPIIEALYSKTPVITNRNGVFPEAGGPTSIYIDPYDFLNLAEQINLVLSSEILSKQMKEEGLKFVQKFNDDLISKEMMEVYSSLV